MYGRLEWVGCDGGGGGVWLGGEEGGEGEGWECVAWAWVVCVGG